MRCRYKCGHPTPDIDIDEPTNWSRTPTIRASLYTLYASIPCRECARRAAQKDRLKTVLLDERRDVVLRILAMQWGVSQAEVVRRLLDREGV